MNNFLFKVGNALTSSLELHHFKFLPVIYDHPVHNVAFVSHQSMRSGQRLVKKSYPLFFPMETSKDVEKSENDPKGAFNNEFSYDNIDIHMPKLYSKSKQKRRKMRQPRRQSSYWQNMENIEKELRLFWTDQLNVSISKKHPPPIPSESLLNHFERHDLRYAIANIGGRPSVSYRLRNAKIIPGKWSQAVHLKEMKELLHPKNKAGRGLSVGHPPISPQVKRKLNKDKNRQHKIKNSQTGVHGYAQEFSGRYQGDQRWAHKKSRNKKGYWNRSVVIKELFQYLILEKDEYGRPSLYMPRPSELKDDLRQAISRNFGNTKSLCKETNLIPYEEWRYFESQLDMFLELRQYLNLYHDGSESSTFPKLSQIKLNNQHLYDLIMEFGGRKLVASKLDMKFQTQTTNSIFDGMTFGPFNLDFAIKLMCFIRNEIMKVDPPCETQLKLQMPTTKYLIRHGEISLARDIYKYGGHENIARRLNLIFDPAELHQDAKKSFLSHSNHTFFPNEIVLHTCSSRKKYENK